MRRQALSPPAPPWTARLRSALGGVLLIALFSVALFSLGGPAAAAEVLQVRGSTLLQVGDRNRSYSVELVCLAVPAEREAEAVGWLRQQLPRRTRVNLLPMGDHDGQLMARVRRLDQDDDLASGLIAAGLAEAASCP